MFIFALIMNSLIPIMMISFGLLWRRYPPKSINWIYGYRSNMSMKNNKTWEFAHQYHGKIWRWSGVALLVFSISFMLFFSEDYEKVSIWINYIELAVVILSIIPTEIALWKRFNNNGESR